MISDKEIKRVIEEEEEGSTLDYKEELTIENNIGKAGFVKDVISLANSGEKSHIIIGVQDGTRKLVGIANSYSVETLNQILKDKSDPPLRIQYKEIDIMGYRVGVIEIDGSNSPYIVSVPDRYGNIERGTVFVRNMNMNEGARRADLDRIYERMKPITLESDVHLKSKVETAIFEEYVDVTIDFRIQNYGDALASDVYVYIVMEDIEKLIECKANWRETITSTKERISISNVTEIPAIKGVYLSLGSVEVRVRKEIEEIVTEVSIGASNMRTRIGEYAIPIKTKSDDNEF
ncbi:helix-turn-helix domain-containing protein [Chloroflexota bacterium]